MLRYLWEWYAEVNTGQPLTYLELQAFSQLTGKALTSFEVSVLMRLDHLNQKTP